MIRIRTKADQPQPRQPDNALPVCALDRWNLPVLRRAIADAACGSGAEALVIPRHARALSETVRCIGGIGPGDGAEVVAGSLRSALDAIGDWWSLLILREAFAGTRRFSDFQKSLGVARNILAARLKKLVALGVFDLVPAADGSAFQEYALTERGRGLYIVILALRQWGESSLFGDEGPKTRLVDIRSGKPIRPLEPVTRTEVGW